MRKKRPRKKHADPSSFPPSKHALHGHISLSICWSLSHLLPAFCPTHLVRWSREPVPFRGESAPFAHVMGRLKGILLESNDLLAHACLRILLQLTYCVTHGILHGAEMRGKPLLSLSTNSVHFSPIGPS